MGCSLIDLSTSKKKQVQGKTNFMMRKKWNYRANTKIDEEPNPNPQPKQTS
jgi:hypothetical protein